MLQLHLRFLNVVVGVFEVRLDVVEHFALRLDEDGELLEELEELIHVLLEPQDVFVLVLDVVDGVLDAAVHALAPNDLLLQDRLGAFRIASQLVELLFLGIWLGNLELPSDFLLHCRFVFRLYLLSLPQDISELTCNASMNCLLHSRLRFVLGVGIALGLVDVLGHHSEVGLDDILMGLILAN